ncbi:MAG: AAA family ATPase [Candidatus Methylumidiphilus sp.]
MRLQRVQSLFEEGHGLIPLDSWLFVFPYQDKQVIELINALMGEGHYIFSGGFKANEYMFERGDLALPFAVLSDGYRAFIGWVGDLLYHIAMITPAGKDFKENRGIVMVDEIDLHLHPKWQMTVLETLAKVLPNIQFIVTSHSPLVAGSLEWMNIVSMQGNPDQSSIAKRIEWPVHGLDADQIKAISKPGKSPKNWPTQVSTQAPYPV